MIYKCTDGNCEIEIEAESPDEAAQEYVDGGDYQTGNSKTTWVTVYVRGTTMKLYHGGEELSKHSGLCLCEMANIAEQYARQQGGIVWEMTADLSGLNILDVQVSQDDLDNNEYPGDRAEQRAAYIAQGVDVIRFADQTDRGYAHQTLRILSEAALARLE